jgi:hypothetical protein
LLKADESGELIFRVMAKTSEVQKDDTEIKVGGHMNEIHVWRLDAGGTQGLA